MTLRRATLIGLCLTLAACARSGSPGARLEIVVAGEGSTNPPAGPYALQSGSTVRVTAYPAAGSTFVRWDGAVTGTANPVDVLADGEQMLFAHFARGDHGSSGGGGSSSSGGGSSSGGEGSSSSGGGSSSGGEGPSSSGASSSSGGGSSSSSGDCPASGDGAPVSINAGGPATGGFGADGSYSGGRTYSTTRAIDTSLVTCNPPPAAVFQTERYGEFTYTLANRTPGTSQTVTLYFAESLWTAAGERTFDVTINGTAALTAFDIFAAAGANKAVARTFTTTADASGNVAIRFVKNGPDNPKVCAITVAGEGSAPPSPAATRPCDLYDAGGTPCVAAHSTVRALYGAYAGSLYQVRRADGAVKDIGVLSAGGFADSGAQDAFCAASACTISVLYDQSPRRNDLRVAPGGGAIHTPDREANASALQVNVGGHAVYAVYVDSGVGYRNNSTSGVATGDDPEGMYMVTSGKHVNGACCFDYGNAETTNNDDGNGTMEAIYFGTCTIWGRGNGSGPWVMADLENGLFAGANGVWDGNTSVPYDYVTAMVKGRPGGYAVKAGNAQAGGLKTMYDGPRPTTRGYDPMHKQGAIILGIGGDNSNLAVGTFFEGCMTSGHPTDATEEAVQANILEAGYGR